MLSNLISTILSQGYVVLASLSEAFGISRQGIYGRINLNSDYFAPYVCKIQIDTKGGYAVLLQKYKFLDINEKCAKSAPCRTVFRGMSHTFWIN